MGQINRFRLATCTENIDFYGLGGHKTLVERAAQKRRVFGFCAENVTVMDGKERSKNVCALWYVRPV